VSETFKKIVNLAALFSHPAVAVIFCIVALMLGFVVIHVIFPLISRLIFPH
jgi:hypothetical protein